MTRQQPRHGSALALGVDIGGTKIAAGLVDALGQVHAIEVVPTEPDQGADAVIEKVVSLVNRLAGAAGTSPVAVGVGTAGQVESTSGLILAASTRLPADWAGTPLGERLRTRFDCPVTVLNDGQAMALGEARFGAARGVSHALCVAIGTGIGGGLVIDGRVHLGAHGVAGQLGHTLAVHGGRRCTCGVRGHLEAYVSGPEIVRRFRRLACRPDGDPFAALALGDAVALSVLEDAAERLAAGIGGLLNAFDAGLVVVGGGVADAAPLLVDLLAERLPHHTLAAAGQRLQVVRALLGARATLVGAAAAAIEAAGAASPSNQAHGAYPARSADVLQSRQSAPDGTSPAGRRTPVAAGAGERPMP